eukprot:2965808-Amphidinium_carterae.1
MKVVSPCVRPTYRRSRSACGSPSESLRRWPWIALPRSWSLVRSQPKYVRSVERQPAKLVLWNITPGPLSRNNGESY